MGKLANEEFCDSLERWANLWGVPGLENRLTITFSPRLRTSLGRCRLADKTVRLAEFLLDAPRELHECGHVQA